VSSPVDVIDAMLVKAIGDNSPSNQYSVIQTVHSSPVIIAKEMHSRMPANCLHHAPTNASP
jgi:hypothetical protein